MNWRELAGKGLLWFGVGLGMGQLVSNCFLDHLFLLGFIPLSLPFSLLLILLLLLILFYFNYQTILISTHKFYFFFTGEEGEVKKQLSGT